MELRVATKDDHGVVVSFFREMLREISDDPKHLQSINKLDRYVHESLESERSFLVLACDPDPIGVAKADMLDFHPMTALRDDLIPGYVDQMYVIPERRSNGMGLVLLGRCEQWLREQGATVILLHALPRAVRLYMREGYSPNHQEMFKIIEPVSHETD